MVGGAVDQSATLLIPAAFQESRTYQTFVKQMLDVVSNDIGGVKKSEVAADSAVPDSETAGDTAVVADAPEQVENFVARKTVGSFIDLAGMATFHLSPLTVLALVSDLAYGSNVYLQQLADELKREGIIDEDSTIRSTAELLSTISEASGKTVGHLDTPPISLEGLKQTIAETTENIGRIDPTQIIPQSEIRRLWTDMENVASQQDVGLFAVSSAMTMYSLEQVSTATRGALTTIRVTSRLVDQHLIQHYTDALDRIGNEGIYAMVSESAGPYIDAVWQNFAGDRGTITEDLVSGKTVKRAWNGFVDWLGG